MIALLGDTHFGKNGFNINFFENQMNFYNNQFFPYILENKIIQSHKDYPNGTDIDLYVECQICSFRAKMLNTHLRKHHVDITVEDFDIHP